jgi:hypothetical protein
MNTPSIDSYSDTFINVSWTALTGTDTGNSPITSYALYWNAGTGVLATTLVTEALITSYQFTSITGGSTYYFKVIAKNIYGYGTESALSSVTAIDVPGKMAIPDVTNSGTTVIVDFAEPNTHYSAILEYDVQFKKSDGTYGSLTCTESDLVAATKCTVNTAAVKTLTSLAVDSLIRVKVRARNAKGWGAYSELNSAGALI